MFYQDVNEQFEGYTQPCECILKTNQRCFIRMSMNNLKDIHNPIRRVFKAEWLFYQDVNEQFEGYTQPQSQQARLFESCFIRMSMNNLKDIHNSHRGNHSATRVVLSGCQ